MTTGTIIMIICLVLLGLLRFLFKKDMAERMTEDDVISSTDFVFP